MAEKQETIIDILKAILDIQEYDMQMIQLMRLKRERQKELESVNAIKQDLLQKSSVKEEEITELKKEVRLVEGEIEEIAEKLKRLESQQSAVKKVDEFNALSQEMSQAERARLNNEQRSSDLHDKLANEEDIMKSLQESLAKAEENSEAMEKEIHESIKEINGEGHALKVKRDKLVTKANPDVFAIYERLLKNKKDRVIVPIENRCCSGCHITLTAQHENLVRKGERLVFCEHCSRIHYWPEAEEVEEAVVTTKRRRRRPSSKV